MPRKLIKKYLPDPESFRNNRCFDFLGDHFRDPGVWHLNRRSVSGAVAIGLFMCWVPFPFQMVIAAMLAVLFRVNVLISASLVWVTNPVTIPPMFYSAYLLGSRILGRQPQQSHIELKSGMDNGEDRTGLAAADHRILAVCCGFIPARIPFR